MANHQSFHSIVDMPNVATCVRLNTFDVAASLEVAAGVADREGMHGVAERLRSDVEFLRSQAHRKAVVTWTD